MRFSFTLFLILSSLITLGQKKKIEEDLIQFDKIATLQLSVKNTSKLKDSLKILETNKFNQTLLEKVVNEYDKFLKKFPDSKLIFKAMSNKGEAQLTLNKTEDAKTTFLELINSNADDNEGISHTIFTEPKANYKNRAVKTIAEIEFNKGNFKESIKFLELTETYKYKHFCLNEVISDKHSTDFKLAKCYFALKNYKKVNSLLLQTVFDYDYTDMDTFLYKNLLQMYKKEELKIMFNKAIKNIIVEKKIEYKRTNYYYYINFLNTKINLMLNVKNDTTKLELQNKVNDFIKNSKFCSLLL